MPTEAGDMKLLGNFRNRIDHLSADSTYNPANASLSKTALEAQYTAALGAVEGVSNNMAPNKIAIGELQLAFDYLPKVVTRSRSLLKATGISSEVLADAETFVRKLTGSRKSPKAPEARPTTVNPGTPENEAGASHSASQLSYDNQVGNFGRYVAILSEVPAYSPNETDLKIAGLNILLSNLCSKNDAVSSTFAPLSQAPGNQDRLFCLDAASVVNTALLAKAYLKRSPRHQQPTMQTNQRPAVQEEELSLQPAVPPDRECKHKLSSLFPMTLSVRSSYLGMSKRAIKFNVRRATV